ncbi:MAG TPA: fibrobacter succinogenes major paralogous domain-containing protein [Bacteroidales bacterium]|nr:fibrobacter succinogenes major paralogous domain-containing protein [Bacteroidales bacterium]
MKNKQVFIQFSLLLVGLFLVFATGCKKKEEPEELKVPTVSTTEVTNITIATATSGGTITDDGGADVLACGICWSTSENPTIENSKTTETFDVFGGFKSNMNGLAPNTTYYVKAYATNSVGTAYGEAKSFTTSVISTFIDSRDNITYLTIKIGDQVWMAENLKYLPSVVGPEIGSDSELSYYVYSYLGTNVDIAKRSAIYTTYGVLYNWEAAKTACPEGWHLPSDAEWKQLEVCLGMTTNQANGSGPRGTNEGGKLKEGGLAHWISPNEDATNEVDFTARPGGYRSYDKHFKYLQNYGYWWTATEYNYNNSWSRSLSAGDGKSYRNYAYKSSGFSVRCVQNN